MLEPAVR
jgi:hypothetical protein